MLTIFLILFLGSLIGFLLYRKAVQADRARAEASVESAKEAAKTFVSEVADVAEQGTIELVAEVKAVTKRKKAPVTTASTAVPVKDATTKKTTTKKTSL